MSTMLTATTFALLVTSALTVSPHPQQIAPVATTCAFYEMALEYASVVQPNISVAQQAAVYDALALQTCKGAKRPSALGSREHPATAAVRHPRAAVPAASASLMIFVDWAKGKDSAAGTMAAPLKTIAAAQTKARGAKGSSIQLRGGVHYLAATVTLTAADSGLTIEAYNNENATVSGAAPLTIAKWLQYNVSKGPSPPAKPAMSSQPNTNCLFGEPVKAGKSSAEVKYAGKMPSVAACSAACAADKGCAAFTWHDNQQPKGAVGWDQECFLVQTGAQLTCKPQTHHFSGTKAGGGGFSGPQNVYVAHGVEAPNGMTGLRVGGKRAIRARW